MRRATVTKTRAPKAKVSRSRSYPPPVGGWNARDALAAMSPLDAVILDNWFPNTSSVDFRGGMDEYATGMTGNGKTLATYNAIGGTSKLFCYTASGIYDVSSAGAVGSSKLARTNGKHQTTMFGDGSSNWLIAVNGADEPAYFDGSSWTAVTSGTSPALTSSLATTTDIVGVAVFKGRLFFIRNNKLGFDYLDAGVAGGDGTFFDLAGEASRGGYLVAITSWSRDAGDGMDDFFVAITSQGEAIVYQGDNPDDAASWAKVGTYFIGKPIGRRCVEKFGSDVIVITEFGVSELSKALETSAEQQGLYTLSDKIGPQITSDSRLYGSAFGWQALIFPARNALIVNIPLEEDGTHYQYVMNTKTKAWCRFKAWDAECFGMLNGELYFASGTSTFKAWTGTSDDGDDIIFYGKQAFQDFGDPNPKHVNMYMPILAVNGNVAYGADIDVDFGNQEIVGTVTYTVSSAGVWDSSLWDQANWAVDQIVTRQWSSPSEWLGRWIAGKLKITSNSLICQWMGSSIAWEPVDNTVA
jgi:hypothetical protein